jgi:uncharacterized membrane-anchored protein
MNSNNTALKSSVLAEIPPIVNKYPQINASFWATKEITFSLGSILGSWISILLSLTFFQSRLIFLSFLLVTIFFQVNVQSRCHTLVYWMVILSMGGFSSSNLITYYSLNMDYGFEICLFVLFVILLYILAIWFYCVGNLSLENMNTKRSQLLYWMVVLITSLMGNVYGKSTSYNPFGLIDNFLLITGILILLIILFHYTNISKTFLFWSAMIFSRSFGVLLMEFIKSERGLNFSLSLIAFLLSISFFTLVVGINRKFLFSSYYAKKNTVDA